jgi:putative transposase
MFQDRPTQIALFRYGIISDFVNQFPLKHGDQEQLIRYKCDRSWQIPGSDRTKIARATILNWIRRYHAGHNKFESLYPRSRNDRNRSRAIDDLTVQKLTRLTKNSNIKTVRNLISEMYRQGLVAVVPKNWTMC